MQFKAIALAATLAGATRLSLDLDGDGRPDTVVLSQGNNAITVTIHFGDPRRKPEQFHFRVDSFREDAVCRLPVVLRVEPHGFQVVDGACDSLHFYWDAKKQRVEWWRL
jgi:hypothetical protein